MLVYRPDGTVYTSAVAPVYNDLTTLPVLDDLPDAYNMMITLDGPNGRYVNLLPAKILRDIRLAQASTVAEMGTVQQSMATIVSQLALRKEPAILPQVTLTAAELVSALTASKVFNKTCTGIKTTDSLLVTASSLPAGYGIRAFSCVANDSLRVDMQLPPLLSGGTPITLNVTAFR